MAPSNLTSNGPPYRLEVKFRRLYADCRETVKAVQELA